MANSSYIILLLIGIIFVVANATKYSAPSAMICSKCGQQSSQSCSNLQPPDFSGQTDPAMLLESAAVTSSPNIDSFYNAIAMDMPSKLYFSAFNAEPMRIT
jgi:hypothetical protein